MTTYKEASRMQWSREIGTTNDDLKIGCLQRIADATEAMSKEYNRLLADAKWQREAKERAYAERDRLARSNAALRGVIRRMKKAANT